MSLLLLFLLAVSLLLTHELDAVRCREWRVFPVLARVADDERGYQIFTTLHVPLFLLVLWAIVAGGTPARVGLDLFCIVHVGLHCLFRHHPEYRFQSVLSRVLILGAGVAGAADLLLFTM